MTDEYTGETARWSAVPLAGDEDEVRRRHEANRAAWNEAAAHYTSGSDERIAELRERKSSLHPIEREMLGDLSAWCEVAIHLQCASGRDTLSLWLEGARQVIGVDISETHIANARLTSAALGAPAQWYRCDILDVPHSLDGTADLVYTGRGAINWIHDLDAWGRVIARLLKPGGLVSVFDDHAIVYFFDPDADRWVLLEPNYFEYAETSQGWASAYIGDSLGIPVERQSRKYERAWPPSAVFRALIDAGLTVERFGEHPDEYYEGFPNIPPEQRGRVPLTFSILARKPGV